MILFLFLIAGSCGSALLWVMSSFPNNYCERLINKIAGITFILFFTCYVCFILINLLMENLEKLEKQNANLRQLITFLVGVVVGMFTGIGLVYLMFNT